MESSHCKASNPLPCCWKSAAVKAAPKSRSSAEEEEEGEGLGAEKPTKDSKEKAEAGSWSRQTRFAGGELAKSSGKAVGDPW